jgi:hypothetical protein
VIADDYFSGVLNESDPEGTLRRAAVADGRIAALEYGLEVRTRSLEMLYERVLRVERDRAVLENEVVAAQRDLRRARSALADERSRREDVERRLAALENTKMFRWLRPLRDAYGRWRRVLPGAAGR